MLMPGLTDLYFTIVYSKINVPEIWKKIQMTAFLKIALFMQKELKFWRAVFFIVSTQYILYPFTLNMT